MKTLVLACEVLRPELELLAAELAAPPELLFLEQRLHDYPDRLRAAVQEQVDAFEEANDDGEELRIIFGYGLCGRGLNGVHARRAVLVFPALHDCIPLLLGCSQPEAGASSREGATFWITPGWLQSFLIPFYLEADKRQALYAAKFGEKRAARMIKAEWANLANYKNSCHIRWPEMGDAWVDRGRRVAEAMALEYSETSGKADYLRALLAGGEDEDRFVRLLPGQTLDMDLDGRIVAVPCAGAAGPPLPEEATAPGVRP